MELDKKNVRKIIEIVAFGIILYFILQNLVSVKNIISSILDILSPFILGAGLAFILNIPMKMFERKLFKPKKKKNGEIRENKLKRPICIILSIIIVVFIISFVIKLVIPQLISVIVMFAKNIPNLANDIKEWALSLTVQSPDISEQIKSIEIDWQKIVNDILNLASNVAGSLVTSSIGFVIGLIGGIFDTIVSIVFAVYILTGKEKLKEQAIKIIQAYFPKNKANDILEISSLSKNTFSSFIIGQCTEAVILGGLCFVGMLAFRLPFAATISILVGVMSLVPIVGAFIGVIIGAILILSVSPIKSVIFIVFFLILQQVEGNAIYPKVVGNSVGLPGMWVLFAVVLGGGVAGPLGLLLGLPTVSVLYSIFRKDVNGRLKKKADML